MKLGQLVICLVLSGCGLWGSNAEDAPPSEISITTSTSDSRDVVIEGDINADLVQRTIRGRLRYVRDCYFAHPPKDRERSHYKFLVRLQIHKGGEAKSVRPIYNSEEDEKILIDVGNCVADIFAATKFPSPRGSRSVEVIYPITFNIQR